jgi:hypothetical protein
MVAMMFAILAMLSAAAAWSRADEVRVLAASEERLWLVSWGGPRMRLECVALDTGQPIWWLPASESFMADAVWPAGTDFVVAGWDEGREGLAWVDGATGRIAYFQPSWSGLRGTPTWTGREVRYLEQIPGVGVRLWRLGPSGAEAVEYRHRVGLWGIRQPSRVGLLQGRYLYEPEQGIALLNDEGLAAWSLPIRRAETVYVSATRVYVLGVGEVRIHDASDGGHVATVEGPPWWGHPSTSILATRLSAGAELIVMRVPTAGIVVLESSGRVLFESPDYPALVVGPYLVLERPDGGGRTWVEFATGRREVGAEAVVPVRPPGGARQSPLVVWEEPRGRVLYLVERGGETILGHWRPGQAGFDERAVRTGRVAAWTMDARWIYIADEARDLHVVDRDSREEVGRPLRIPPEVVGPFRIVVVRGRVGVVGSRGFVLFAGTEEQ